MARFSCPSSVQRRKEFSIKVMKPFLKFNLYGQIQTNIIYTVNKTPVSCTGSLSGSSKNIAFQVMLKVSVSQEEKKWPHAIIFIYTNLAKTPKVTCILCPSSWYRSHTHCLNIPAIHCIHDLIFPPATFSVIAAITFLPQGRVLVKVKWLSVSCKRTQQWNTALTSRRLLSSTFICLNLGLENQSGENRPLGRGI